MNTNDFKRFDMKEAPRNVKWYLRPVIKLLINPGIRKHQPKITYVGTENIKGPFLLLCNHNAFQDFKVSTKLIEKENFNYVVAIDGFLKREALLRNAGCICKRKFTNDITLVRNLKKSIDMGHVAVIYPEARYSLCGTTAVLPKSLGKMAKMLKVPVVTLICHGHHVNSPFWDSSHDRGVKPTEATYRLLVTKEELETLSADEINERIVEEFQYDDFRWQKERGILIKDKNRALNLHKVLYQCPVCRKEFMMTSGGTTICCGNCGSSWEMTELGELKRKNGDDIFTHIPDWYEWERENVKKEIESGTYSTGILNVQVDSMPKDNFIDIGKGTLIHDMNGFRVSVKDKDGDIHEMIKDVPSLYSCHIEYNYLFKKGDAIDLNTIDDTWYIFPEGKDFSVTKIALATEELYFDHLRKKGIEVRKGLA